MSEYDEQAAEFLRKTGADLTIRLVGEVCPPWDDEKHVHGYKYLVKLHRGTRTYSFDYWNSLNDKQKKIQPCSYDVLSCLSFTCPDTFKDFCSEYGYDEDSRKAETTFCAVQHQAKMLQTLFNDTELEMLGEIR